MILIVHKFPINDNSKASSYEMINIINRTITTRCGTLRIYVVVNISCIEEHYIITSAHHQVDHLAYSNRSSGARTPHRVSGDIHLINQLTQYIKGQTGK